MAGISFSGQDQTLSGAGWAVLVRRILAVVVPSLGLSVAGCSSTSMPSMPGIDSLKPKPTTTLLLIESNPAGAEAKSSLGKACRTPCTMLIGEGRDFTVTFTLAGYVPQTLNVHSTMSKGDWSVGPSPILEPGSLFPTLEPANPGISRRKAKTASRPAAEGEGVQQ
jgi:hypothetical protein